MSTASFYDVFPITSTLLLLIVSFFVLEQMSHQNMVAHDANHSGSGLMGVDYRVIDDLGGLYYHPNQDVGIGAGEIWRFISCMFLHFNLMHLAFNAMALFDLGRATEEKLSSEKLLTIFVVSGLVGGLASFGWRWSLGLPLLGLGASGAICGLIGMLLVYSIRTRDWVCKESMIRTLIIMAVFSLLLRNQLDHRAHLGGFAAGCVFGIWVTGYTTSGERERWKIPARISGALLAAGLLFAIWNHGQKNWNWNLVF